MSHEQGTLLVVDDDELNRDFLSRRLERRGYEVAIAADGAEALKLADCGRFDLVLLDIMMPGLTGLDVLKELRLTRSPTALPVIMATARDASEDVVQALELGANDYVTKPLDFPVVLARVRNQLALKRAVEQILQLERSLSERNEELTDANAKLTTVNQRMQKDLNAAARVQESLLPKGTLKLPGFDFRWLFRPCDELAGDCLNFFRLDERTVALYVLDVSGHGVASSLLSVTLSRFLSAPADSSSILVRPREGGLWLEPVPPAEVADYLNRRFPLDPDTDQYFTIAYGLLDVASGELRFISAGHPSLIHVPARGQARTVETRSFPVGWEEVAYDEHRLVLEPGDRLYLYSDGIPEAMNSAGRQYGTARLAAGLEAARGATLAGSIDSLNEDLRGWCDGERFRDDLSLLAVERAATAAEPPLPPGPEGEGR